MAMAAAVYLNTTAKNWQYEDTSADQADATPSDGSSRALAFHKCQPLYSATPLYSLSSLAKDLGVGYVLLKDESSRFGLPSFKILGASWGVYRAVEEHLKQVGALEATDALRSLSGLGAQAKKWGLKLSTATAGNWGRAVASMAKNLGIPALVYVPSHMPETTRNLIRGEEAEVMPVNGSYDDAVEVAKHAAGTEGHLLVMDISWEGYTQVPEWVVEGYQTMLDESDAQALAVTGGKRVTHAVIPVGCGLIAQAVTQHYKSSVRQRHGSPAATVIAVEPTTAACLRRSLEEGKMTSVATGSSIMSGMNCGTLSTISWPVLKSGVNVSVVVSEAESHAAVQELDGLGVQAGPCGAATLASLKRVCALERGAIGIDETSVIILYCTEGARDYQIQPGPGPMGI
ncbi:tryptophan synthase beta subunit-like PLP-dependent enzyme [Podospora appendiculata]|uniref:Tryptophan synthase beta subunit-like PLP-dependent enzyme n=1 Tax=Podospora appendiculata TaxID=314037 RepID=A0AAE0XJA2_9PEZI|nr:tryptophan synthase beta subunit-like PLP-dependent enzyme [Podospora appendiculata]